MVEGRARVLVEESSLEATSGAFGSSSKWVTFEEPYEEMTSISQGKEKSPSKHGKYLSQLERELQRLQEKSKKPLSSKDIIRTLQEAKDSHMKQLMDNRDALETFVMDDIEVNGSQCCFPLYRTVFPKQPLTKEELECLVDDGEDSDK